MTPEEVVILMAIIFCVGIIVNVGLVFIVSKNK